MIRKISLLLLPVTLLTTLVIFLNSNKNQENTMMVTESGKFEVPENIPPRLVAAFSKTDWSKFNPALAAVISGGPSKDGIPALDNPTFISLDEFVGSDSIQAIVLQSENEVRVYPYNILTWHEIVNDTFEGTPVAITFCPLCGSAVVFDRTLPDQTISTFGVSGSLLESNMIMYDRQTENLWQQSTGVSLAGSFYEEKLTLYPFQLLELGDIRSAFPNAEILDTRTGYSRDYNRNPYAGYETDDRFVFEPSSIDARMDPKEIMVVFYAEDTPIAISWNKLRAAKEISHSIDGELYELSVLENGELTIIHNSNALPFYFEMWFSVAVQHGEALELIEIAS